MWLTTRYAGTDSILGGDVEVAVQVKHMPVPVGYAGVRWRIEVGQKSAIALKKLHLRICLGETVCIGGLGS